MAKTPRESQFSCLTLTVLPVIGRQKTTCKYSPGPTSNTGHLSVPTLPFFLHWRPRGPEVCLAVRMRNINQPDAPAWACAWGQASIVVPNREVFKETCVRAGLRNSTFYHSCTFRHFFISVPVGPWPKTWSRSVRAVLLDVRVLVKVIKEYQRGMFFDLLNMTRLIT